ncbi:cysteine proteinase [Mytilinidion resinicola]|uniref:ubiquitinyl hydrolase 1 n=1 Tax=Mytilinidion resinicola TaxID=574789 RepID=A0A6A6YQ41_9PEZI|nr:cysteine proteinase [Mytilinidion resinicola]KAF2811002.1 cysteine proteinase [Mytilinidion resinicola]
MSGMTRFLSRREKNHDKRRSKSASRKSKIVPSDLYTIFSNEASTKTEKDSDDKVKALIQRLNKIGVTTFGEEQCAYALAKHADDPNRAYEFLILAQDSFEGILKDIDPGVKMLGAENRNYVTCYLDALLFAMFARLDSFEAILYNSFEDEPRKKLSGMLRLWVNMLRSGKLITVDLVGHVQAAIGDCGWEEACEARQQDASEAFTFITGKLELPLLTLKMDIYHTGKEEKEDDHKFVNERLLEVALPEAEEGQTLTLEDCLESYFNNKIEVKRILQRRTTLQSVRSMDFGEKTGSTHIETVEISSRSSSPAVMTPMTPTFSHTPASPMRPVTGRGRADSIFSERYVKTSESSDKTLTDELAKDGITSRPREGSLRKEVMMPAWQFFSLIRDDAQVAAHFSAKRPVLGICLKRYTMLPNGTPKRLHTFIDIPLEIGLPHFISDDRMDEEGPLFGNFKLVLQSVVCHRGVSVDSGHYVALVRANVPTLSSQSKLGDSRPGSGYSSDDAPSQWMRFDDLAKERVTDVDIKQALKDESPYLLFYQVQPIDEDLARGDPPSYSETQSGFSTVDPSVETLVTTVSEPTDDSTEWDRVEAITLSRQTTPAQRLSTDVSGGNRRSISFDELEHGDSTRGRTPGPTPAEERKGFLSASRSASKSGKKSSSKSRPTSQSGESSSRLSLTMSRLTGRGSKDKLQIPDNSEDPVVVVQEVSTNDYPTKPAAAPDKVMSAATLAVKSTGMGRSKSKRGKEKEKKKGEGEKVHRHHHGKQPDRECIVM